MARPAGAVCNISREIDDGPVSFLLIQVGILCAMAAFLDGLDTGSIGLAGPLIAESLKLSRAHLGPIFSASLLGAMLGALTMGSLADRFGRRRMLILATVIFGVFTCATGFAASFQSLLLVRFLAGIGLGGATPCFITLTSEYAPKARRALATSMVWTAFPLGIILGTFLNGYLLSAFNWHAIFLVGGTVPLLVALAMALWLPESIRFLIVKRPDAAAIRRIAARLVPGLPGNVIFTADAEEKAPGSPLRHLFLEGRSLGTLLLWVVFLTSFGTASAIVLWAPSLMRDDGIPLARAAVLLGFSGSGVVFGTAVAGKLVERFGVTTVLAPALIIGAISTATMAYVVSALLISIDLAVVGVSVGIAAAGTLALATTMYPTEIRSSGLGWAIGMGRFGQVLVPLLAALMIKTGWRLGEIYVAMGMALVIGTACILLLRWHTVASAGLAPGRRLNAG